MIEYFIKYHGKLEKALLEHLQIVSITLVISILLAAAITVLVMKWELVSRIVVNVFSVIYSIPSLALFAMLIPLMGIGKDTAITVLVIYNQFLLIRNFLAGFNMVDKAVVEAAVGMGMSERQVLVKIKLPLAMEAIVAGIHLAIISTIGIATIGATINAGGLGTILFDGLRTQNTAKILWGTVLSAGLAFLANGLLNLVEKKLKREV
ncbi:MAG: binding-protein-dependent transport system inner rane component [Eubacterium sp.]|nr:binding-protein-dependent transport system inner rane component [Eubacterium sp.]